MKPLTNGQAMMARIAELEAALKRSQSKMSFKVGKKGGVCVYGLQRFPTTLYADQWERLFGVIDDLKAFIEANRGSLKAED